MLERHSIDKQYVYYIHRGKYILINSSNGRWRVFDKYEKLDDFINSILSNNPNSIIDDFCQSVKLYSNPTLHLHLTNKCNLRCPHCYMRAETGLENELSSDEFIKLISNFKDNGGERVVFSGGEISLVENFMSILKHSKEIGLYNLVITNGTLWSEADILEAAQYTNCVQISIDGYDEISNSKIRGTGSFDKALKCIDSFLNANAEVLMTVTPVYGFENEVEQYISFGNKMVEKYKNKKFYIVFNDYLSKGRSIDPNPEKNDRYYQATLQILEGIYPQYTINEFLDSHKEAIQNCGYGKIAVDSDGTFTFCTSVKDVSAIGNVRTTPMKEIVSAANLLAQKTSVENLIPCKHCDFKFICGGDCRIDYYENADQIVDVNSANNLKRKIPCSPKKLENFLSLMVLSSHQKKLR